jgi:hypothetical protein
MNPSKQLPRVRRRRCLAPEVLESRLVMSAGQGATFAIMPGAVNAAGQVSSVNFKVDPTLFTAPRSGKLVVGIDVAPAVGASSASSSTPPTFKPEIISITTPNGRVIPAAHTRYNPKVAKANHLGANTLASAVIFKLPVPASGQPAADYSVQVKGMDGTSGQYLLGFYLAGDVTGTGTVTQSDVKTIGSEVHLTAASQNYNFEADLMRDGIITQQDVMLAQQNLTASTKVSPVVSVNLDPASNPAANRTTPYSSVHFAGQATPGATVSFVDQASGVTTKTTVDSTGAYSIMVPLVTGSNTFKVTTMDGFGQSISGAISPVVYSPPAGQAPGTTSSGSSG